MLVMIASAFGGQSITHCITSPPFFQNGANNLYLIVCVFLRPQAPKELGANHVSNPLMDLRRVLHPNKKGLTPISFIYGTGLRWVLAQVLMSNGSLGEGRFCMSATTCWYLLCRACHVPK